MSPSSQGPPPYHPKPAGTAIPATERDDDSDETPATKTLQARPMLRRLLGGFMSDNQPFDPQRASWDASQWIIKTVFFGFVAVVALHWFRGWLACQHSVRADFLEDRVEQLEDEKRAVEIERDKARGIYHVEGNAGVPTGGSR